MKSSQWWVGNGFLKCRACSGYSGPNPQGGDNEARADQTGHHLGDVHDCLQEHDHRQRDDRIERAVLEVAVLGERALLHEHDRQAPDEHGADAEADGDDEEVVREREGADHAVEAEARVEHLEVEERRRRRSASPLR